MIYSKPELVLLTEAECIKQGLDAPLMCSIIEVVSEWNPARVELCSDDSWVHNPALAGHGREELMLLGRRVGLCQFSGIQARELGNKSTLDELLSPAINLQLGVEVVKRSLERVGGQLDRALIVAYGHPIVSLVPKIVSKIAPFRKLLADKPSPVV